jgi:hypothetical protein
VEYVFFDVRVLSRLQDVFFELWVLRRLDLVGENLGYFFLLLGLLEEVVGQAHDGTNAEDEDESGVALEDLHSGIIVFVAVFKGEADGVLIGLDSVDFPIGVVDGLLVPGGNIVPWRDVGTAG